MELYTEQLFRTIVEKAWEDDSFKASLVADPVSAIEDMTGESMNIPEGKTVVVEDQTDKATIYLNIPAQASSDDADAMDDMELSDDDLDIIAGGGDPVKPILQSP